MNDVAPTLLLCDRLCLTRSGDDIVHGFSLTVRGGAGVCLTGPNGSGKSTLLRAMAGLLSVEGGAIACDSTRSYISPVPLPLLRTRVADWIIEQELLSGTRVGDDPFGIAQRTDMPLFKLSSGWRQRVKLSRLLPAANTVWLLDEPEDSLDSAGVEALRICIAAQRASGGAVVIASHMPDIWADEGFALQGVEAAA